MPPGTAASWKYGNPLRIRAEGKYPECEHFHFLCDSDGLVLKGECCNVMHKLILDVEIPRGTKL